MDRRSFIKRGAAAVAGAAALAAVEGPRSLTAADHDEAAPSSAPVVTLNGHMLSAPAFDTHRWYLYADLIQCIECNGVVKDRSGRHWREGRLYGHDQGCTVYHSENGWSGSAWRIEHYKVVYPASLRAPALSATFR